MNSLIRCVAMCTALLLTHCGTNSAAAAAWRIEEVMPNRDGYLFRIGWTEQDLSHHFFTTIQVSPEDAQVLSRSMGAAGPTGLPGRVFGGDDELAEEALGRKIFFAKHPDYRPVPPQAIYDQAAAALALMECPDLSNHDPRVVDEAFRDGYRAGTAWVESFDRKVRDLSAGKVSLKMAENPYVRPLFGDVLVLQASSNGTALHVSIDPFPDGRAFGCPAHPPLPACNCPQ